MTVSAKLRVPAGAPDQDSCGEIFSPTQFELPGVLLPTFFGRSAPSLKVVEAKANASAAMAVRWLKSAAIANAVVSRSAFARLVVMARLRCRPGPPLTGRRFHKQSAPPQRCQTSRVLGCLPR